MAAPSRNVLALNCGSSSLKFGLYSVNSGSASLICEGEAEEIGGAHGQFWFRHTQAETKRTQTLATANHKAALHQAIEAMKECGAPHPDAVGHRVVHGGPKLREHQVVRPEVVQSLEDSVAFAPLHLPAALAILKEVGARLPGLPQVACFDTAFHRTLPDVSRTVPLSGEARRLGVERFGFHGLSLESILAQMTQIPEKLIVAHLGNGCSVTAINSGKSIDTSMGLTPTGGIMMGTRCGDLDPGALLFLMQHGFPDRDRLSTQVDHRAGLLGVSETTSDVRELLNLRGNDKRADLALRMFAYQVKKAIAGMAAALGGIDRLVFAGGIGENNTDLRNDVADGLRFLGSFDTVVISSQEDLQIARLTDALLASDSDAP
ncbi:MAG: acetate/propionate family kinase [Bryobacteraceae bacterium]